MNLSSGSHSVVNINSKLSDEKMIKFGVPQGSVRIKRTCAYQGVRNVSFLESFE